MINILVGIFFIFFKTNLSFFDIGSTYYVTNIIGYIFILFGINELGSTNQRLLKVKLYVKIMIAHSILFFLLTITGNSPFTMPFSTTLSVIIALIGVAFMVVGMFFIFVIMSELMKELTSKRNKDRLYNLVNILMLVFILAGLSALINFVPILATFLMGALVLLQVLFLFNYYYVFLSIK